MIVSDIINSKLINNHSHILLYKAMITEVNIDWLLEFAMTYGKQCYLPRVNGDNIEAGPRDGGQKDILKRACAKGRNCQCESLQYQDR